jgi:UDP-N-acetyl-D-galactosamine dehydrogenase
MLRLAPRKRAARRDDRGASRGSMFKPPEIAVIGLGYVGLPLALALARHFPVTGFDINAGRIGELKAGHDRTGEVSPEDLRRVGLRLTADDADLAPANVYIVTVPTPVDERAEPDLRAVRGACATIGPHLGAGDIVVLESTVYPGVTEEICGPVLATSSGLVCGRDFFLGYSPERINPGDREHTVDRITKVVSGQTPDVAARLSEIYGAVTAGNVFVARDIRTAEAAKVIENAQRDINIAFINEVAEIFHRMGISTRDVLEAARTKWNFLPFSPGLVGGHCIGVDPFYLAFRAKQLGYDPEVILAGRRINDRMGSVIADAVHAMLGTAGQILVLGVTFKENVPDLRNTKVIDVVRRLEQLGHTVSVHDPLADPAEAAAEYALTLRTELDGGPYDAVIAAVPHAAYRELEPENVAAMVRDGGVLADIKGMWRQGDVPGRVRHWVL